LNSLNKTLIKYGSQNKKVRNKKVGGLLFGMSVILLVIFVVLVHSLQQDAEQMGCFQNEECQQIEASLNIVHFAFGIFGFLFALSFYLFFFSRGEEAIVQRLEADSTRKLGREKFSILLQGLDTFEQQVMKVVKNQEGITQNTLRLKVDMSKAKLSQVLASLEKKGLIKREKEKKTLAIFLKNEP
jgi:Zn-dependent protease with chaperone function